MERVSSQNENAPAAGPGGAPAGRRREAIDAFIDIVLEGGAPPTPEAVADRAGVSRATFFRYFSTLAELRAAAAARVIDRFPDLFDLPEAPAGVLGDRVRTFVDARLHLHETLHPLELLIRSFVAQDDGSAGFVDASRAIQAEQVRDYFGADLGRFSPARRDDAIVTISLLTSVESWQQFRLSNNRSPAQTRRAWAAVIACILDGA